MPHTKNNVYHLRFAASIAALAVFTPSASAQTFSLLTNGNFETGNFSGWTVANVRDPGTTSQTGTVGNFFIDTPGTTTPAVGVNNTTFSTAANASGGSFYAVSSSDSAGESALIHNFTVPNVANLQITVTFQMFVNDQSGFGGIVDSSGLDYTTGAADPPRNNQHARVDVLSSSSTSFTTMPNDIVRNLYIGADTAVAAPGANPYTTYSFNISSNVARGQTYRLRFAEVDNLSALNMGVDNVVITAVAIPEPGAAYLFLVSSGLLFCRRSKKAVKRESAACHTKTTASVCYPLLGF